MLGKVRPSSCSLECLELERPPSKAVKEATILKLRQGSQRELTSTSEQTTETDVDCISASMTSSSSGAMTIEMDSPIIMSSSTHSKPGGFSKEQQKTSVVYLFARYKSCRQAQSLAAEGVKTTESSSSSASCFMSPAGEFVHDSWSQLEQECGDCFTIPKT